MVGSIAGLYVNRWMRYCFVANSPSSLKKLGSYDANSYPYSSQLSIIPWSWIATRYGLEGSEFKLRWGEDFPHPSSPGLRPTQPPTQWVPCLFLEGRAAESWRWPLTPYSAEVKEIVELYLCSLSGLHGMLQCAKYLFTLAISNFANFFNSQKTAWWGISLSLACCSPLTVRINRSRWLSGGGYCSGKFWFKWNTGHRFVRRFDKFYVGSTAHSSSQSLLTNFTAVIAKRVLCVIWYYWSG